MKERKQNYYGSLCTEMYEILHRQAPKEELDFYVSYAKKEQKILEALCGSGRFLVPFMKQGFDISGVDLSGEMLDKLKQKAPNANVVQADILEYSPDEPFDYIFISSGSVSLFTDIHLCKKILKKLKGMLAQKGKLVFAVDTVANRCPDDSDYKLSIAVKTKEGLDLTLRSKNYYDESGQTQFSPGIYELYDGARLLKSELMDLQTHLYKFGEMEQLLTEIGFTAIRTYSSFKKEQAINDECEMFLFECTVS